MWFYEPTFRKDRIFLFLLSNNIIQACFSSPTHEIEIWLSQLSMRLTWAWPSLPILIFTSHTIFLNQKGKWTYSSKRHLTLWQYSQHKRNKACCRNKFFVCFLLSSLFIRQLLYTGMSLNLVEVYSLILIPTAKKHRTVAWDLK